MNAADEIITEQQLGLKYSTVEDSQNMKTEPVKKGRSALDFAQSMLSGETDFTVAVADRAFNILCSECHFLVEEKLGVLVEPLDKNERRLILLDAIFSALNVDSEQELATLIRSLTDAKAITETESDPNLVFKVSFLKYMISNVIKL